MVKQKIILYLSILITGALLAIFLGPKVVQGIVVGGQLDMSGLKIINVGPGTSNNDVATYSQLLSSTYWTQSGSNLYPNNTAWNVGIGTTAPMFDLQVGGYGIASSQLWGASSWAQSGLVAYTAGYVNDGSVTSGFHTDSSAVGSYLRLDAGAAKSFTGVTVWSGGDTQANISQWDVQYSDNDAAWSTAYVGLDLTHNRGGWVQATWQVRDVTPAHRYWRLYKTNAPVGGSYVYEVQFFEAIPEPNLVKTNALGNVGIGTASPVAKLDVNGDLGVYPSANKGVSGALKLRVIAGTNATIIQGNSDTVWTDHDIIINAANGSGGNTNQLVVYRTGNVGIGTAIPNVKLEVQGDTGVRIANNARTGTIDLVPSATLAKIFTDYYSGGDMPLVLGTYNNQANQLYLATTGNVGVGTTTPATKFEVAGGPIKATGGLIMETRTTNPASPVVGQIWMCTDTGYDCVP